MIKFFGVDLDGTLTNGCYCVFSHQEGITKQFNTRDFHGMMLLHEKGVECRVITMSSGLVIRNQAERSPFPLTVHAKVKNKKDVIVPLVETGVFSWDEIAYIGDDVNDLELLRCVGMAACPPDADPEVLDLIQSRKDGWVMDRKGGEGCVREFANLVLKMV